MSAFLSWLAFAGSTALIVLLAGGRTFAFSPFGATFLTLWLAWSVIISVGRQRGTPSPYDRSGWTYVALGAVGFGILVLAAPWEYSHFDGPLSRDGALPWCGLALLALGISLQAAAMWYLRGFFTVYLAVRKGQRVTTGGPYRLVRHPAYLSYLISLLGIGLALGSLAVMAMTGLTAIFLSRRIVAEEKMLLAEFGQNYKAYRKSTRWRLIPFVY